MSYQWWFVRSITETTFTFTNPVRIITRLHIFSYIHRNDIQMHNSSPCTHVPPAPQNPAFAYCLHFSIGIVSTHSLLFSFKGTSEVVVVVGVCVSSSCLINGGAYLLIYPQK
eukprot:140333_1